MQTHFIFDSPLPVSSAYWALSNFAIGENGPTPQYLEQSKVMDDAFQCVIRRLEERGLPARKLGLEPMNVNLAILKGSIVVSIPRQLDESVGLRTIGEAEFSNLRAEAFRTIGVALTATNWVPNVKA